MQKMIALLTILILLLSSGIAGGEENITVEHWQLEGRDILAYVPATVGTEQLPLVLVLTYTGGTPERVVEGCGWDKLAEQEGFIVVSPDYNNYATYSETEFIVDVVAEAVERYPVNTARIYSTGFSNGGAVSVALTNEYPDVFAAISCMGWMVDMRSLENAGAYDMPFQVIQGTQEYTEQTSDGAPMIMDDERNAIRSLLLYNEMITENTIPDYEATPYWGYTPDQVFTQEVDRKKWTISNYLKNGVLYAQLILIDGAEHVMHPGEATAAWAFLKQYTRNADGSISTDLDVITSENQ